MKGKERSWRNVRVRKTESGNCLPISEERAESFWATPEGSKK